MRLRRYFGRFGNINGIGKTDPGNFRAGGRFDNRSRSAIKSFPLARPAAFVSGLNIHFAFLHTIQSTSWLGVR
ncbi:MAG: hypothetical protein ACI8R4_000719 [Paracoccaceae bacterium]